MKKANRNETELVIPRRCTLDGNKEPEGITIQIKPEAEKTEDAVVVMGSEEDRKELAALLLAESTPCGNWRKHLLAFSTVMISLAVNFIRGSKKSPSLIGMEKCGVMDWSIFGFFVIAMLGLSYAGLTINKRE
jgi:hypothetical protein